MSRFIHALDGGLVNNARIVRLGRRYSGKTPAGVSVSVRDAFMTGGDLVTVHDPDVDELNATAFPAEPGWRLVLFRMGEAGPERMTEPKPIIAWRYPDFYGRPDPITADGPEPDEARRLILVAPVGSATIRDAPSQHPAGPDACVTYATLEAALAAIEAEREEDIPEFGRIFADEPEDSA
jgi:hypothetical protein